HDDPPIAHLDESLGDAAIELRNQRVVEAADIQQTARLAMDAELRPGDDLAEFLERPEAAGHRDERIRERGHRRLAFVHRVDDAQVWKRAMGELAGDEGMWNDADGVAARLEHRVGDHTHESNSAAAEDEADSALDHFTSKPHGGRGVPVPDART